MKFDSKQLSINDGIYHLSLGYGKVTMINADSALASFSGQIIGFNIEGRVGSSVEKVIGLARPMIVWPTDGEDITKLVPLVQAAIQLIKV
jgi:hypothetical protein